MSKKNNKFNSNKVSKVDKQDITITNDVVYVRVVRNFNDGTDSERFISAGPNTYYKTNKERADMLVRAGYCEYDNEAIAVNINADLDDANSDDIANVNENNNDVVTDDSADNSNDVTNDNVNDDNTSNDNNASGDSEDTDVNDSEDNNNSNDNNPNE